MHIQGQLPTTGFVRQEQVEFPTFLANRFGKRIGNSRPADRRPGYYSLAGKIQFLDDCVKHFIGSVFSSRNNANRIGNGGTRAANYQRQVSGTANLARRRSIQRVGHFH